MNARVFVQSGRLLPVLFLLAGTVALNHLPTPPSATTPTSAQTICDGNATTLLPAGVDQDWWTVASQHLAEREYRPSPVDGVLQAPNRAQNLRFHFESGQVRAEPRHATNRPWTWTWRTTAFGRENARQEVMASEAHTSLNRVEYARDGFCEWYLNTCTGLEQGFDLARRPDGTGRLCVTAEVGGDLRAELDRTTGTVDFLDDDGAARLTYDKLLAVDATGRELPGEMQVTDSGLRLLIDDTEAVYPVVIDPLLSTPEWERQSDTASAQFGYSVCTAGDVNGDGYSDIIVGAPGYGSYEVGAAFVFHGSADGPSFYSDWDWDHYNYGARFGESVAGLGDIDGDGYDDVAVGAPEFGDGHTGEVRVFRGSETGLLSASNFIKQGDSSVDAFGTIVAAAGDVNGDGYADLLFTGNNDVYLYYGSASGIDTYPYWHESDSGGFGTALAGVGDVNGDGYDDVVIGSPNWDTYSATDAGRVQLYLGDSDDLADTPSWTAYGGLSLVHTGYAVSAAGDMNGDGYADFMVSTPQSSGGHDHYVRCYYGGDGDPTIGWSSSGEHTLGLYGTALAPAGDVNGDGYADVMVACEAWNDGSAYVGRVDVHYGGSGTITGDPDWWVIGEQDYEHFGGAIGPAGDVNGDGLADVIIGARDYTSGQANEGRALVYLGSTIVATPTPNWVVESNQEDGGLGTAVACLGDVNGDGYSDVLVGASAYDYGQTDEGAAFLFLGTQSGLTVLPFWYCESNQAYARLGLTVAAAGDVNGDGYPEGIVGAPYYDGEDPDEGRAYVWHSTPGGIPNGNPGNADWIGTYADINGHYAAGLGGGGDVNGDGYSDVVVGVPFYSRGTYQEGIALVYHGSASGLSTYPDWVRDTNHASSRYGISVDMGGDFNGDGFDDIVVGAPGYDHPSTDEGLVFVYIGGPEGIDSGAPYWYAEGNQTDAELGHCVAFTGDVDATGTCDVMAGSSYWNGAVTDGGAVFAWRGGAEASSPANPGDAYWTIESDQASGLFNVKAAPAGDVNGDGYGDVILGLPHYDTYAGTNAGAILLYLGGPDGLDDSIADGWALGDQDYAYLGQGVAGAGDVNGDGFDDIIVGAHFYDAGQDDEGRIYVFYGNGSNGPPRKLKQMRSDFSAPIAPGGWSDSETSFGLDVMARSTGGRGRVRLEWEADEVADAFASPHHGVSDWYDTGEPDGALGSRVIVQTLVDGLGTATRYAWRVRIRTDDPAFAASPWLNLPNCALTAPAVRTAGGISPVPDGELPDLAVGRLVNHPNPFNPSTTFRFNLDHRQHVELAVYDVAGRRVATLQDGLLESGPHALAWHGCDDTGRSLASGVYCAKLVTGSEVSVRKVTLAK